MNWELAPITGKITGLTESDTGLMGIYLSGRWSSASAGLFMQHMCIDSLKKTTAGAGKKG